MRRAVFLFICLAILGVASFIGPSGILPPKGFSSPILWEIRAPRVVLAALCGATLSASGAALQAVFHNPLVDPYLLGLSAGGALGCALSVAFFPFIPVPLAAFICAYLSAFLTYALARTQGGTGRLALILSGVVVSAFLTAIVSLIKFLLDPHRLTEVVLWLMGSFALSRWEEVEATAPLILAGCFFLFLLRHRLNVLSLPEEEAKVLGVSVGRERALVIGAVALGVGASVAAAGVIGWIGLMVPHLVRLCLGPENQRLVPYSMMAGAAILVAADTLARSLTTLDLPVGILTSLLGVPFFVYLLRQNKGAGWDDA